LVVLLPLAVFGALAVLFGVRLLQPSDPTKLPSVLINKPAPAIDLPPLAGLAREGRPLPGIDDAAFKEGVVTVVNVFASWCAPCHAEHPFLLELAKDPGIRVVGINQKDKPENALKFLTDKGNPYAAVGVDATGRASIEWGVYGVPETFIVRGDGVIAHKFIGPIGADTLNTDIRPAIAAARAARS
jgi:cytochrome c biogenesis protein CcmG/thiol:disulfide interchange protein DsbE